MATKKEKQKAMLVSAAATNEPYTSKHTGEEIDSAIDKALAMDPYTSQADELKTCVKMYPRKSIDFNTLTTSGFYALYTSNQNGPAFIYDYGTAAVIRGYGDTEKTLAQMVFPFHNYDSTYAIRVGSVAEDNNHISKSPWLYFHGSTSPNIPVLKKKTITGTTSSTGNIPFSESPIILSAYSDVLVEERYSYICIPWINASGTGYIRIVNSKTNDLVIEGSVGNLTVYYLEIPSDYTIPNVTPAYDESEDD